MIEDLKQVVKETGKSKDEMIEKALKVAKTNVDAESQEKVQPEVVEAVVDTVIEKAKESGAKTSSEVKEIIDEVIGDSNPDMKSEDLVAAVEELQPDLVASVLEQQKEEEQEEEEPSTDAPKTSMSLSDVKATSESE